VELCIGRTPENTVTESPSVMNSIRDAAFDMSFKKFFVEYSEVARLILGRVIIISIQ
jgi:hypothetical protein